MKSGPIGGLATRFELVQVANLIDQGTGKWNELMVKSLFDDQRVKEILATPTGLLVAKDKLVQKNTKSRSYTMKIGYFTTRESSTSTHNNSNFISSNETRTLEIHLAL